jgi:tellurite resistance protein TerC
VGAFGIGLNRRAKRRVSPGATWILLPDMRNSQETQIMSENNQEASNEPTLLTRILSSGWIPNLRFLRRIVVAIVGFTVLLVGVAMVVLPGPAFIVIPLGLAILATEFVWAHKLLEKAKNYFEKQRQRVANKVMGKK